MELVSDHDKEIRVKPQLSDIKRRSVTEGRAKKLQLTELDWTHLSDNYPNLIGVTDEDIENFLFTFPTSKEKRRNEDWINMTHLQTNYQVVMSRWQRKLTPQKVDFINKSIIPELYNDIPSFNPENYPIEFLGEIKLLNKQARDIKDFIESFYEEKISGASFGLGERRNTYFKSPKENVEWGVLHKELLDKIDVFETDYSFLFDKVGDERKSLRFSKEREDVQDVLKRARAYNRSDLLELSQNAFKSFKEKWIENSESTKYTDRDFSKTVFITSPRGGLETLGVFSYANNLDKGNLPYDFIGRENAITEEIILESRSMPYGEINRDIEDLVFVDDIFMSGEQAQKGFQEMVRMLEELDVTQRQEKPRLHYISLIQNKDNVDELLGYEWDTISYGDSFGINEEEVSGVVFPFSIPDGDHHEALRLLYSENKNRKLIHTRE